MQIAAAPNAFRGSLTAFQAAACIAQGLQSSRLACDVALWPLADGGDGTLDVLMRGLGGERLTLTVTGADGQPLRADLGLMSDGQTAVIELAQASGIEQIPRERRNALTATTFGTGELIRAALEHGYRRLIVGLGGSATTDGGAGLAQALGAKLLDADGTPIPPGGAGLLKLARIDAAPLRALCDGADVVVLCDVDNPLTGERGAARIFGPQKGANDQAVETLDDALSHFAETLRRDVGADVEFLPGAGAAGGCAAGLVAFLKASIAPGADTLIRLLGYEEQFAALDLVITGEGKLDAQTAGGKAVRAVAARALAHSVPAMALVGALSCSADEYRAFGIDAAWSIVPGPCDLIEATTHAAEWLTSAASRLGDTLAIVRYPALGS
ncbi:MAG: glycerate kinase family protein [Aggregatilineales bacterium]